MKEVRLPGRLANIMSMEKLRASASAVGSAMGSFFVVVGLSQGSCGFVSLGIAVALIGFFFRRTEP